MKQEPDLDDTPNDSPPSRGVDPLLGGGEMGALMRSIDWSRTAVGAPSSLAAEPAHRAQHPARDRLPHVHRVGTRVHPVLQRRLPADPRLDQAPGGDGHQHPRHLRGDLGHHRPDVRGRDARGPPTTLVDFLLPLDRHGFVEECYFIFSYSPIRDESGDVGGVLVTVTETTERVLGERRLKTLRELAARTQKARDRRGGLRGRGRRPRREPGRPAVRAALPARRRRHARRRSPAPRGLEPGDAAAPARIDLAGGGPPWPLARASSRPARRGSSSELPGEPRLAAGAARALVLPIAQPGEGRPAGVLVAALSPRLVLDDELPQLPRARRRRRSPPPSPTPARWPRPRPAPRRWPSSTAPRRRSSATSATSSARR